MATGTRQVLLSSAKIVGILALLYLAVLSVRQGLADSIAEDALTALTFWAKDPADLTLLQSAYQDMVRADQLDGGHPTYLHRLGRISHLFMALELSQRDSWAALAKDYYRASLAVRPAWPLTWANLALVKADLLEFDAEMDQALINASTLGPWEPGVQVMMTEIAMRGGQFMRPDVRAEVYTNISRGLVSPVKGTGRDVYQAMAGHSVEPQLAALLEDLLVADDWSRNTDVVVQVAIDHLALWQPATLPVIRGKIVAKLEEKPQRVRFLNSAVALAEVCPYLPRKRKFINQCKRLWMLIDMI